MQRLRQDHGEELLEKGRRTATFYNHIADTLLQVSEFQAVAEACTSLNFRLEPDFSGGIGKADFQSDHGPQRDGTGDKSAHAAMAQNVAAAKYRNRGAALGVGHFQAHVNAMARPTPRAFAGFCVIHMLLGPRWSFSNACCNEPILACCGKGHNSTGGCVLQSESGREKPHRRNISESSGFAANAQSRSAGAPSG